MFIALILNGYFYSKKTVKVILGMTSTAP